MRDASVGGIERLDSGELKRAAACNEGPCAVPFVSEMKGGHGVHGQTEIELDGEAGPRASLGASGFSAGLARPVDDPHAHRLRAGVSLLFVPLGHVRLPDRRAGQF